MLFSEGDLERFFNTLFHEIEETLKDRDVDGVLFQKLLRDSISTLGAPADLTSQLLGEVRNRVERTLKGSDSVFAWKHWKSVNQEIKDSEEEEFNSQHMRNLTMLSALPTESMHEIFQKRSKDSSLDDYSTSFESFGLCRMDQFLSEPLVEDLKVFLGILKSTIKGLLGVGCEDDNLELHSVFVRVCHFLSLFDSHYRDSLITHNDDSYYYLLIDILYELSFLVSHCPHKQSAWVCRHYEITRMLLSDRDEFLLALFNRMGRSYFGEDHEQNQQEGRKPSSASLAALSKFISGIDAETVISSGYSSEYEESLKIGLELHRSTRDTMQSQKFAKLLHSLEELILSSGGDSPLSAGDRMEGEDYNGRDEIKEILEQFASLEGVEE